MAYVTAIQVRTPGKHPENILAVWIGAGPAEGPADKKTSLADTIKLIQSGTELFVKSPKTGKTAMVRVVTHAHPMYIRSSADHETDDNLLHLPQRT